MPTDTIDAEKSLFNKNNVKASFAEKVSRIINRIKFQNSENDGKRNKATRDLRRCFWSLSKDESKPKNT